MSRGRPIAVTFGNLLQRTDLPLLVPHGREPGDPPAARPRAGCRSSWATSTTRRRTARSRREAVAQPPDTAGMTWTSAPAGTGVCSVARSPATKTLRCVRMRRAGVEHAVRDARDLAVEVRDHLGHGRAARLDPALGVPGNSATSERGRWTIAAARVPGHRRSAAGRVGPAVSRRPRPRPTRSAAGCRRSATSVRPSSRLPYSWPVLVPK